MAYLGKTPSQAVRQRYIFTQASAGATSISGTDDSGNTLTFTDGGYVDVYLNGVLLVAGTDYNTTTANTIGGLTALSASDVVEIVVYDTFSVFGGDVQGDLTISNGDLNITDITAKDANGIQFNTDEGTERARINDSGYLLIGKTTSDDTNAGMRTNGNFMSVTRDGGRPVYLNRLTDDGDILEFAKDNTKVGSIGVRSGDILYIATDDTSDCGLKFDGDNQRIEPCNADGTGRDASLNLGTTNVRFKDLYLSGGVFLGGTGAANYLDDYEEGTWTPQVLAGNNGSDVVVSNAGNRGNYIKIGTLVYLEWRVNTSTSSTASLHVEGLPFTSSSTNAQGGVGMEHGNTQHSFFFLDGGAIRGYDSDNGVATPVNQASGVYRGSIIYRTS